MSTLAGGTRISAIRNEPGQTMAEYAVVLAVVTAGVVGILQILSGSVLAQITRVAGLV